MYHGVQIMNKIKELLLADTDLQDYFTSRARVITNHVHTALNFNAKEHKGRNTPYINIDIGKVTLLSDLASSLEYQTEFYIDIIDGAIYDNTLEVSNILELVEAVILSAGNKYITYDVGNKATRDPETYTVTPAFTAAGGGVVRSITIEYRYNKNNI